MEFKEHTLHLSEKQKERTKNEKPKNDKDTTQKKTVSFALERVEILKDEYSKAKVSIDQKFEDIRKKWEKF